MRQPCPHQVVYKFSIRNVVLALSLAIFASLFFSPPLNAQNATTGALTGVVADSSGAAVPGATVTLTDTATGASISVTANDQGRYTAPLLKPSNYKVTATANGLAS